MSDKLFGGILIGVIVIAIGALLIFSGDSGAKFIGDPLELQTGQSSNEEGETQPPDRYKGPTDAPVTLIEYADFGCPACLGFFPELQQIEATYADQLLIIYRHNPISNLHPNAVAAHRASEAAANQGMFWEMHDLLFQGQQSWAAQQSGLSTSEAADVFEGYASQLNLDLEQFRADVESQTTIDYINSHFESGLQLGVSGTPTIFLNGEEVEFRTFEQFSVAIDEILSENNQEEASAADPGEEAESTEPEEEATN